MSYKNINYIVNEAVDELKKFSTVKEIRLFGSQVHTRSSTSDIDLFIECVNNNEYEIIIKILCELSCKHDVFFHPVVFNKKTHTNHFHNDNIINNSLILFKHESVINKQPLPNQTRAGQ